MRMAPDVAKQDPRFVCVHCGRPCSQLYQRVGQEFRMQQCAGCGGVVDRYIECDMFLVLIDLHLFREGVYRHILCNRFAADPGTLRWGALRLLLLCLLLDTHARLSAQVENDLIIALLVSVVHMAVYLLALSGVCLLAEMPCAPSAGPLICDVAIAVSVSSFWRLLSVVALVWDPQRRAWVHLTVSALVLTSNALGVKTALHDSGWHRGALAVTAGTVARTLADVAMHSYGLV